MRSAYGATRIRDLPAAVFEVASEARNQRLLGDGHRLLILICFDFVAAFPTAAHHFLQCAMAEARMPDGFIRFVAELCRIATLHLVQDGWSQLFPSILVALFRGSPLSASLFLMNTA